MCENTMQEISELRALAFADSVANHRMVFHADRAQECLDMLQNESCDQWKSGANEPACNAVFEPRVAPSGACTTDSDCIGGQCEFSSHGDVCIALASIGQHCHSQEDCAPDLTCAPSKSCVERSNSDGPCVRERVP